MARRRCGFVRGSSLRRFLIIWTFVAFFGVISGRLVDDFQATSVTPKSPSTCGPRPTYCISRENLFQMPWSSSQKSVGYSNYNYRFDSKSVERSKIHANISTTIFYRYPESGKPDSGCLQVLNLTWTVRLNDSDLPIAGFKLTYIRFSPSKNVNKSTDLFFFINQEKLPVNINGNTMFYYDCLRLSIATQYRFELFSLHSPSDRVPERLVRSIGVTTLNTDCDTYPDGHFTPNSEYDGFINVIQRNRDCGITVYFSPAPDTFGVRSYDVQLLSNEKVIMKAENLPFKCDNYEPVRFENVGPGEYQIKVIPAGGHCRDAYCKPFKGIHTDFNISDSNFSDACRTAAMSANVVSPPALNLTPGQALAVQFEVTSRLPESPSTIKNQNVIIAVIAFTAASAVVLTVILLWFKSRKCRGEMTISAAAYSSDEKDAHGGKMTREPVVLVYTSDNSFHNNVVQCLATYLQTHCHCDVRFDQWFKKEISEVSALDWILQQLRSVKNVIIINSEAGFRHYEALTRGVAYERIKHDTPLENMFLPAMRELRSEYFLKPKSRQIFKVTFPYTDSEFVINDFQPGITYQLMTHVEDLTLNIHGLSKHSSRGKTTVVDINEKDYIKSPEGHELEKAIREACEYSRANPNWFSYFYREKPRTDQNIVCSSMNKDWNERYSILQNGSPCTVPLCPVYDSGLGTSNEYQNVSDSFLKMVSNEEQQMDEFQGPDLDDVSSVCSANLELQGVLLNKDFDSSLCL